ncbi:MAG: hypothetical protein ACTS2F_16795 [Thainema sp.]
MLYAKYHTAQPHMEHGSERGAIADLDLDARRIFARSGIDFSNVPTSQRQRIAMRLNGLLQQFRHPN